MDYYSLMKKKRVSLLPKTPYNTASEDMTDDYDDESPDCTTPPSCFFCAMREPDGSLRMPSFLKEMPLCENDQDHVLVLSGLWHRAMTQPNDPELPSLGIFKCMANLISRATRDKAWLLTNQNIYIPYYAAHIIGSYTMNRQEFAQLAVESGVIPPLLDLLRGKISWVEQRVAVRAVGHLASYESTFEAVAEQEQELVKLAMNLASTCLDVVYVEFVGSAEEERVEYHRNLMTRGVIGDLEMENRKAEEWASQTQCWSLQLLSCFASKDRPLSLTLICRQTHFLKHDLCRMWGGLVNHASPAGVGLIRILCYTKLGSRIISESPKVIRALGNVSRSCDDWQYMGIDCLVLLLKNTDTRHKVIDIASPYLVDLIEITSLGDKSNVGETITKALLMERRSRRADCNQWRSQMGAAALLEEEVERRKKEKGMSEEKLEERRVVVGLMKQQAKEMFRLGRVEEALAKYCEALKVCPLRYRKERMVLYSNKAECNLVLRDPDSAISDATRALCLCDPVNTHGKSLWRRSQAYDMKGMAKESLLDCILFITSSHQPAAKHRSLNIVPYHAARIISKHMDATWLFAPARSRAAEEAPLHINKAKLETNGIVVGLGGEDDEIMDLVGKYDQEKTHHRHHHHLKAMMEKRGVLSTIIEEPALEAKEAGRRKMERERRRLKKSYNIVAHLHQHVS